LPDLLDGYENRPLDPPVEAKKSIPTGYGCTGSWMYGVHEATRSPSLARDLLQEITSLDAVEERARRGAGIPSRKDYFELHGNTSVPGMEYLTWRKLLRYAGSRARRRERVLSEKVPPAQVYQLIHNEVLACLALAKLWIRDYQAKPEMRGAIVETMDRAAREAFDHICEAASPRAAAAQNADRGTDPPVPHPPPAAGGAASPNPAPSS